MASTKRTLEDISSNLEESMGVRRAELRPVLAPIPGKKDAGRRPLRNVGKVTISQVIPDPTQPRVEFSDEALERLALSIREKGQLSPIRVRWSAEFEKWIIISGERRWRAAQRAGIAEIDCYFHEGELTSSEILEQQMIENCLREDLQPIEEAKAFSALMKLNDWTGKQVAEALRVHPTRVSRALGLLKLPESVQQRVAAGDIPARAAYELSKLENRETQNALVEKAVQGTLSTEKVVRAVRQRKGVTAAPPKGTHQTFFGENEWKVVVSCPRKGTYHEMEQALEMALEEVRHRINSGVTLF